MTFAAAQDLPATANAVLVSNISNNATEKAVKDFFSFCGRIVQFEMKANAAGDGQEAFILFERESAANTARLLSNAVIVDRSVQVTSYFVPPEERDPLEAVQADERAAADGSLAADHKPYTRVIAELLAEGYQLSENVVKRGLEVDDKYAVTKTLSAYFFTAKARAEELDEQYKVVEKLKEIDSKWHISENAHAILAKGFLFGEKALATPTGQKVKEAVDAAREKAREVADETRAIVQEKHTA
ncbi:hypothetical protein AMAG_17264 [Allomyces macrogynus ATCC 38327]|uniref:RRM domain-containing protein n=1 Tax=Allomyces macrogynus (strain ATCC 38327) TaxID=578462 RepID=A0A0L0TEJ4_ALLM3|nr:hypothetical protein AMAG_17264 [Allomyces macrogynus ATCC 38327]|eukprot:KNE73115.1 hypothetical protein AMAG_17264 [Allomyces macrogynus ATCC 38327]